jgi:predicted P-loop ATPase
LARVKLERRGLETIGKDLVQDAVAAVARYHIYHPIRDDLGRVIWDGSPRLGSWLVRLAGTEDSPYVRAVGRKFLIQMVARVMRPGCKADHVLVLSGAQGIGKSTACRILAGDYFSDNLPPINGGKDTMIHLRGKWLIELSEMAPSRKSEAEDLKAFLTTTVDSYRDPYGRTEGAWPRQCVFVGTTNSDKFLNDETGGRRFWPVTIPGVIDTDGLAAERDQLLAEALAAFSTGESWHLPREFEAVHAKPVQDTARVSDTWAEIVTAWLDKPIQDFDDGDEDARPLRGEVTIRDVLADALGIPPAQQNTPVQRRAAAIMRQIGWTKSHTRAGNTWRRPGT